MGPDENPIPIYPVYGTILLIIINKSIADRHIPIIDQYNPTILYFDLARIQKLKKQPD
jgi:hypothetical protein